MSQNPIVLPTTGTVSGLQMTQDTNAALDTLNTKWSGSSAPSSPEQYQDWLDTSTSPPTLRIYDGSQWVAVGQIDMTNHVFVPTGLTPTGFVGPFAGSTAPSGWLLCYGQAVSRTTYAALFAVIGSTYGAGDGSTTFNVPDMRGRAAFGVDNMGGSPANRVTSGNSGITGTTLGAAGGDERLHQHTHTATVNDGGHSHLVGRSQSAQAGSNANTPVDISVAGTTENSGTSLTGITVTNANTGSGGSQNMPPAVMLNYLIKT